MLAILQGACLGPALAEAVCVPGGLSLEYAASCTCLQYKCASMCKRGQVQAWERGYESLHACMRKRTRMRRVAEIGVYAQCVYAQCSYHLRAILPKHKDIICSFKQPSDVPRTKLHLLSIFWCRCRGYRPGTFRLCCPCTAATCYVDHVT